MPAIFFSSVINVHIQTSRVWHLRVIPELLDWTDWKMDRQWFQMCSQIQRRVDAPMTPFHQQSKQMKMAMVLDFDQTQPDGRLRLHAWGTTPHTMA